MASFLCGLGHSSVERMSTPIAPGRMHAGEKPEGVYRAVQRDTAGNRKMIYGKRVENGAWWQTEDLTPSSCLKMSLSCSQTSSEVRSGECARAENTEQGPEPERKCHGYI